MQFFFFKLNLIETSPKIQNNCQFSFSPSVSSFYLHNNNSKIGYPIPFTPKNICTPTPINNGVNSLNLNKMNEEYLDNKCEH